MIQCKVLKQLENLEQQKYDDEDITEDIKFLLERLGESVQDLRYPLNSVPSSQHALPSSRQSFSVLSSSLKRGLEVITIKTHDVMTALVSSGYYRLNVPSALTLPALVRFIYSYILINSSFDEYSSELKSGRLEWSPVHKSEKFWRENAVRLNEKNYELLK